MNLPGDFTGLGNLNDILFDQRMWVFRRAPYARTGRRFRIS